MFKILTKYTLSQEDNKVYNDIAYDGNQTYLCTDDKQVVVLDEFFAFVESISTYYSYHTLCYDNSNHCFWAASLDSPGVLFKLSATMEIDTELKLSLQGEPSAAVDFLFYDSLSRRLLTAINNKIYNISQTGELQLSFELTELQETPLKICILSDRFICISIHQHKLHIKQFSRTTGYAISDEVLPEIVRAKSITVTRDNMSKPDFALLLLAEKQEFSPCLFELKPEPSDMQIQQLGRRSRRCPFWIEPPNNFNMNKSHTCSPDSYSPNQDFCNQSCGSVPLGINYCNDCCGNRCSGCCDSNCCHPVCNHQACTQVIESIALTETSIAHILNAEGEKLQKAIACCSNVNELLKVNESVIRTIIHSTQLEQVLFYKLDSALRGEVCDCQPCSLPCHAQSAAPLNDENNTSST